MCKFEHVRIPKSRELFARYGFSRVVTGHPDNTDPNHWTVPGNLSGKTLQESLQNGGHIADRYIEAARAAEAAKAAAQTEQAPPDTSGTE